MSNTIIHSISQVFRAAGGLVGDALLGGLVSRRIPWARARRGGTPVGHRWAGSNPILAGARGPATSSSRPGTLGRKGYATRRQARRHA